ncbi:MAG: sugar phosphate nucleotidyltransferase [archaeon]
MEYAVIMAGGSGTRFWPKSTRKMPKQCLALNSDKPMIVEAVERLSKKFGDNLYIATGQRLKEKISEILPDVKFILEPCARNTTGCIGLSCVKLLKKDKDAIIFIETADHVYKDEEKYFEFIKEGIGLAKEGKIVTFGITPFEPSSAFGYIEFTDKFKGNGFLVKSFVEKPSREIAMRYLQEGNYLWNSGMFVFRADKMLEEIKNYEPEIYEGLMKIYDNDSLTEEVFENMKSISIDYAVAERTKDLVVVKADMDWDDIGSWNSLERHHKKDNEGNVVLGKLVEISSYDNIIISDKLVATVGLKDMVIVSTDKVILVCPKSRAEEVKLLIDKLKIQGMNDFL